MKRSVRLIANIIFVILLIFIIVVINQILVPKYTIKNSKWPTTTTYNQFYEMESDSIDVLFLGASVVVNAYNPQELYNKYGIRSYNLGSEQQSLFLSYYWLEEALRFQHPKVVVVDTNFLVNIHPESPLNTTEPLVRKCIDPMRFSRVKYNAIHDLCSIDPSQNELSYYLTNIRFHSRWSDLTEQDFILNKQNDLSLKGYGPLFEYGPDSYETFFSTDENVTFEFNQLMLEYLDKIVELCRKNNISLILTSLPGLKMEDGMNNALVSYSKMRGVQYLNFYADDLYNELGLELPKESIIEHSNIWGSIKLTDYLGDILLNEYDVQPARDMQFEESKKDYELIKQEAELTHIEDAKSYVKDLVNPNWDIFFVVNRDVNILYDAEVKTLFTNLGLNSDMENYPYYGYLAAIEKGNLLYEQVNYEGSSYKGIVGSEIYKIISNGYNREGYIYINDNLVSNGKMGLNIVVYSEKEGRVVDSVTLSGESVIR